MKNKNLEYKKYLYKLMIIKNSISLICFTILSIVFGKWWIVFFSALFLIDTKNEEEDTNEKEEERDKSNI